MRPGWSDFHNQALKIHPAQLLGILALVAGLSLCACGIFQLVRTAQYAATANVKVEYDDPWSHTYDPYFIQTTFEIIKSQLVLSNVVATCNLNEAWGKKYSGGTALKTDETIEIIRSRLKLAPIRNTKLIAITIYSEDPKEAAQLANAVATAYKDYRVQNYKQTMASALAIFRQKYQEEESRISTMETNLASLYGQLKIKSDSPAERTPEQQPYWDQKRELDQLLETHKMLNLKITAEEIDMKIPTASMVQIIDSAKPPSVPIGPNRIIAVLMIVTGVFLIIAGLMWLKSNDETVTST